MGTRERTMFEEVQRQPTHWRGRWNNGPGGRALAEVGGNSEV